MQLSFCRKAPTVVGPLVILMSVGLLWVEAPAQEDEQSHDVPNYLHMGYGDIKLFVGGSGNRTGLPSLAGVWKDAAIDEEIGWYSVSDLNKQVSRHENINPDSFNLKEAETFEQTISTSTSGSFSVLALKRSDANGNRPTGKTYALVSITATTDSYPATIPPVVVRLDPNNLPIGASFTTETASAWIGQAPGVGQPVPASASGKRLVTLDWDTATLAELAEDGSSIYVLTVAVPGSVHAETTAKFTNVRAVVETQVLASAQEDTRSATITRSGAHDERVEGDITHGDTVYSHWVQALNGTQADINTQNFNVEFEGEWTTRDFYYNGFPYPAKGTNNTWSPESDVDKLGDSWKSASYVIPYGSMDYGIWGWQGTPTGQTEKQITYIVKDNPNNEGEVTAERKYVLHLHDPVEVLYETSERVTVNVILRRVSGTPITTPDKAGGVEAGSVTVEQSNSSSSGYAVGASFDVTNFIKFLNLDFQYSVQDEVTTATTATLTENVPEGSYCYALVTHGYERVHKYLYKYDAGERNVRKGRGAMDGNEDPNLIKEVPHEAFADKFHDVSTPFWSAPIDSGDLPITPDPLPPYDSTYTS